MPYNITVGLLLLLVVACSEPTTFNETEVDAGIGNRDVSANTPSEQSANVQASTQSPSSVQPYSEKNAEVGAPPAYDPVTHSYALNIVTSVTKPLTNVILIIDNSFSMTAIQAKVAAAVNKLIEQAAKEDLNINLHLYTTTDLLNAGPSPLNIASGYLPASFSLDFAQNGYGTHGAKGNSIFANRKYFELVNNVRRPLDNLLAIKPNQSFIVTEDLVLGASQFSGGQNGILKFREGMVASDLKPLIDMAFTNISSLGTNGSDTEQPIAAIYRLAKTLPTKSNERYAFWIVTNEDDSTRKQLPLGLESEIVPPTSVSLWGRIQATTLAIEYESYKAPSIVDGVVVSPESWVRTSFSKALVDCKVNALCNSIADLNKTLSCNADQLAYIKSVFNSQALGVNARPVSDAKCTARSVITNKGQISSTDLSVSCQSIYPVTGKSFADSLADLLPMERIDASACLKASVPQFVVKAHKRLYEISSATDAYAIGSEEIGSLAIQSLASALGPKGYTVGLIANDGVQTCNQDSFSDAVRLRAFMQKTPSPLLKTSVCESDYWNVVGKGIKDFVTKAPLLVYKFDLDPNKIQSVTVVDNNGVQTVLNEGDYVVSENAISLNPGVVSIGDTVRFVTLE